LADPFPYLIRILALTERISSSLADSSSRDPNGRTFVTFQQDLTDFNTSLPPEMQFSIQNFQAYVPTNLASGFVLTHLWFHT
jgi:hypothetical protein